ncbi:MAG: REP-associated tyrosine transposase [Pseudomonas sp.]
MPKHAHSRSLRYGRFSEISQIYLLTTVTQNRHPLFNDLHLGRLVVSELKRAEEQNLVQSLAWVVMPDHLHWLIELKQKSLSSVMQQVKARSAIAINKATQSQNRVWQRGYHDTTLRTEDDLKKLARYIVANPLRAGLVKRIGDYPLWDAIWL